MKTALLKLSFGFFYFLILACHGTAGQVERIENKVSGRAPLKVEFKHEDSPDWTHALEIIVTNTGEKAIYFLFLNLFPVGIKSPDGIQMGFPLLFGSPRMYSADETPTTDDPAVLPHKSVTFKIETGSADGWNRGVEEGRWPKRINASLEIGWIYFGDGSGFSATGVPFQRKNRSRQKP